MGYLLESEITTYTTIPGVTINDVELAAIAINSYKGMSFEATNYTETTKLTKKRTPYGDVYKGKLKHFPRIAVNSVTSNVPSPFGGLQSVTYDTNSILFDEDDFLYFTFIPGQPISTTVFRYPIPYTLTIKYSAGYSIIPDELKRITGLIADSIRRNGGFHNYKSRTDFDLQITFSEQGILTKEIKSMIDAVKLS